MSACPCGSGLDRSRCCELPLASLGPVPGSALLLPAIEQARAAFQRQAFEDAERLVLELLDLAPREVEALALLYRLHAAGGADRAADALLRRIVAINPNIVWATHDLALRLLAQGNVAEAERHARNAVRIAPQNPQSHNLLGMVLTETNRPQMGEYHYRQAMLRSDGGNATLLANLAANLKAQGRVAEARALYRQAAAADPSAMQAMLGWARLEEVDRDFAAAAALLDAASSTSAGSSAVAFSRAVLLGRMQRYDEALALLDARAAETPLGPGELLEKGRLLDKAGRYDEAFAAFTAGKQRLREATGHVYLAQQAEHMAARLRGFFTARRLTVLPRAGVRDDVPQPLFILGFPRSGTTLLEQSLSAHPRINAGDELPLVTEIASILPRLFESPLAYPDALCELWMADHRDGLDNLRDYYLQKARQLGAARPGAPWFTDKMPLNEMHLGLIALIFPGAPLIHVVRHPLDVVLSVFSNALTHGFFCAAELESAARHYVLVMDLVAHYQSEMELRLMQVRYEDVVVAQRQSLERVLGFVGETFDEACLDFHENRRYARTASYAQVAEKLYDRSRFRYRHYLHHLAPVLPILEPVIARLGYSI